MWHSTGGGVVRRFVHDTGGATAIEYALIACGIGVTIASTIWSLGAGIKANLYDKLTNMF